MVDGRRFQQLSFQPKCHISACWLLLPFVCINSPQNINPSNGHIKTAEQRTELRPLCGRTEGLTNIWWFVIVISLSSVRDISEEMTNKARYWSKVTIFHPLLRASSTCHLRLSASAICSDWHSTGSTCRDCN